MTEKLQVGDWVHCTGNGDLGTLGTSTAAPSWVSRSVTGMIIPANSTLILGTKREVPLGAIWVNTAASSQTATLQEFTKNDL